MKTVLKQGLLAGVLSAVAGVSYLLIYEGAFALDFSQIVNPMAIFGSSFIGCMLMALGNVALLKWKKEHLRGWLNILIALLSFLSIISPIGMSLPLDIEFPEMFPGLVVPMHFFPAMAFFALDPFFQKKRA